MKDIIEEILGKELMDKWFKLGYKIIYEKRNVNTISFMNKEKNAFVKYYPVLEKFEININGSNLSSDEIKLFDYTKGFLERKYFGGLLKQVLC